MPHVVRQRSSGYIIAGHTRALAAHLEGIDPLPVDTVDVDDPTALRILAADNRSAERATQDPVALIDLLGLIAADAGDLVGTGYSTVDLNAMRKALPPDAPIVLHDPDDAPSLPAAPVTQPGDVWLLGPHRVICGDSTAEGTFHALLRDERPVAVWTDPPYGVSYVGKTKDALTIRNDDADDALRDLLWVSLGLVVSLTEPGAAWYVASAPGNQHLVFGSVLRELGVLRQTLVWKKSSMVLGHSDYHYMHEMICTGYTPGYSGRRGRGGEGWYGDNSQVSVLEFDKPSASREHPTMKPVALVEKCLNNSSAYGDLVLDAFGGSGTTLIAAHTTGRVARLIELDPKYVDVVCRRYQQVSGVLPVLESSGASHDFVLT